MNRKRHSALRCCYLPQPPLFLLCRPNYMHVSGSGPHLRHRRQQLPEHNVPWASPLRVMDTMTSAQSLTAELGFVPRFDVFQFLILQLLSPRLPQVPAKGNVKNNGYVAPRQNQANSTQAYISQDNKQVGLMLTGYILNEDVTVLAYPDFKNNVAHLEKSKLLALFCGGSRTYNKCSLPAC